MYKGRWSSYFKCYFMSYYINYIKVIIRQGDIINSKLSLNENYADIFSIDTF